MSKNRIGIIGLGKLGLPLALNLERCGFEVQGFDIDSELIEKIRKKSYQTSEPNVMELLQKSKNLFLHNHLHEFLNSNCSIVFVVVQTPSLPNGTYDHSRIESIFDVLINCSFEKETDLVINSTVMPGFTSSLIDKNTNENLRISYNPEFIAQGSIIEDQLAPDQILIGSNEKNTIERLKHLYTKMCQNRPTYSIMGPTSAEITKLAINCFLTTKISFANTVGDLALKSDAETDKILEAVGTDPRIGGSYLKYGYGYGGPCFPRDNQAMMAYGKHMDLDMLLCEATDKSNKAHLDFQLSNLLSENREAYEFHGITYKPETEIIEESQKLQLAIQLARRNKKVIIFESDSVIESLKFRFGDMFFYQRLKSKLE